jgi:hypothetical protein
MARQSYRDHILGNLSAIHHHIPSTKVIRRCHLASHVLLFRVAIHLRSLRSPHTSHRTNFFRTLLSRGGKRPELSTLRRLYSDCIHRSDLPCTFPTLSLTRSLQTIFSSNNVGNVSPVELDSQTSQRSFPSSWSNCPTPQAFLQSHQSPSPEVKMEPPPVQYSLADTGSESHPPKKRRSGKSPAALGIVLSADGLVGKRGFKCDHCNKTFERNSNLTYHLTTHDPTRRPLICDKIGCLRTFNRRADMSRHIRTVSNITRTESWRD